MRVLVAVGTLKKYVAFSSSRLDGVMGPDSMELSDAWYQDLLVSFLIASCHTMARSLSCVTWAFDRTTDMAC